MSIRYMGLSLEVVMLKKGDFVDVILLYFITDLFI
jgi:hypothetical protein